MRLTLCLECGEYLCQPAPNVQYCFEDHLCEVDKPDIENFKKCIEIIQSEIKSKTTLIAPNLALQTLPALPAQIPSKAVPIARPDLGKH